MRDLGPIVQVLVRAMDHGRHYGPVSSWIAPPLVGDQSSRDTALTLQQLPKESDGSASIPPRLHQDVKQIAVFVDGPPEVVPLPLQCDEQLVHMPRIAHPAPSASQRARAGPKCRHHRRMVSYVTMMPHWARRSSASRKLREKR